MTDNKNDRSRGKKDPRRFGDQTVTDVEFKIKKKQSAAQVERAVGLAGGRVGNGNIAAPEQYWEELEDIYQQSATTIVETGRSVNQLISVPGIQDQITNPAEVKIAIAGLQRDLELFATSLLRIQAKHIGKTGPIATSDDYVTSVNIFEEYLEWNTNFQSLITPTVFELMTQLETAYQKLSEIIKDAEAPAVDETTPSNPSTESQNG